MTGTPEIKPMKFAGSIRAEVAEQMIHTIEQDCRRVDIQEW